MPVKSIKAMKVMKVMKAKKTKKAKKAMTEEGYDRLWAWSVANDPSEDLSPDPAAMGNDNDALVDSDADDETNDDDFLSEMATTLRQWKDHVEKLDALIERAELRQWKDPAAALRKLKDLMDRQGHQKKFSMEDINEATRR